MSDLDASRRLGEPPDEPGPRVDHPYPGPHDLRAAPRNAAGSKYLRLSGVAPAPGPPCRNTRGVAAGDPSVSQYSSWPSPTSRYPCIDGSTGKYMSRWSHDRRVKGPNWPGPAITRRE
jgi:hypothetical protein